MSQSVTPSGESTSTWPLADSEATADRLLSFEGGGNFRDLGGLIGLNGRKIRRGALIRGSQLCDFTASDIARFDALGFEVIFDLRDDHERSIRPARLSSLATSRLVCRPHPRSDGAFTQIRADGPTTSADLYEEMKAVYRTLLVEQVEALSRIIKYVGSGRTPLFFGCAAGKDRTGVIAALLLEILGVARSGILADYELTNLNRESIRRRFLAHTGSDDIDDSFWDPVVDADRAYLVAMFDELDNRHGGLGHYLPQTVGLEPSEIKRFREQLLQPLA